MNRHVLASKGHQGPRCCPLCLLVVTGLRGLLALHRAAAATAGRHGLLLTFRPLTDQEWAQHRAPLYLLEGPNANLLLAEGVWPVAWAVLRDLLWPQHVRRGAAKGAP